MKDDVGLGSFIAFILLASTSKNRSVDLQDFIQPGIAQLLPLARFLKLMLEHMREQELIMARQVRTGELIFKLGSPDLTLNTNLEDVDMRKINHLSSFNDPLPKKLQRTIGGLSFAVAFLFAASGIVSAQTDQTYEQLTAAHPGWVQVPGQLMRPDCVHEVPNGARVEISAGGQITGNVSLNGQVIAHYDPCPEAPIPTRQVAMADNTPSSPPIFWYGKVEGAQESVPLGATDNIDWESAEFWVPGTPKSNGALLYIHNGIATASQDWVLMPILQYGQSPAGGGNYWAIASWMVGTTGAWHSPVEKVHTGNLLHAYTQQTGSKNGTLYWTSEVFDLSTNAFSYLTAWSSGLHWTVAYEGVLEAYYATSCSQLPRDGYVHFFYNQVYHGYPYYYNVPLAFAGFVNQTGCANWVDVNNPSNYLHLHFSGQ